MKMSDLDGVIMGAQKIGSYYITVTTKDKSKRERDLNHYAFQRDFPRDDIIPSIDAAIRCMGITPEQPVPVVKPPKIYKKQKPLKIAIITHFNKCPDSYSPGRAAKNQIKILQQYGHKVAFFIAEGSKLDVGCIMKPVVPRFKRVKNVVDEEGKKRLIDMFREHLTSDFDLAITHDLYLDDCITYREAIKECGIPIRWLHWARSGVGHPLDFKMDNARYVYMNYADVGHFARNIGIKPEEVRVVPNEKDIFYMFNFHPVSRMIINRFRLWERDIIMTYPICSTRFAAKGLRSVIKVFVELKRLGIAVALIVANSNGRRRLEDIRREQNMAKELGLNEDELIFTSLLADNKYKIETEVPNQSCVELMQVSNLMIMATIAEVSSQILLEASMTKQLLVLNSDLLCLYDAVNKGAVLSYPFTSNKSLHYTGRDEKSLNKLAKQIVGQIKSNKADLQFRHVWRKYNAYSIYHNFLEPLLYEDIK